MPFSDSLRPTYDLELGDLEQGDGSRGLVFRSLAPGVRVLDVGCDTGRFGEALRTLKSATVDGVERDVAAAAQARTRLHQVWERSIDEPLAFDGLGPYDAVLFLDVLEHLFDPWQVLKAAVRVLRPGGVVQAVVPNVAHVSVMRRLAQGRFEYQDIGTMDRTHVRWFTRQSIRDCFAGAGLERIQVSPVPLVPRLDTTKPLGARIARLLVGALPDAFGGSLHAVGYAPVRA
jgi:2-polyprenyl-3-methyl-5-hydroxy-6-metoxy-1,4-benzoquinol methylase